MSPIDTENLRVRVEEHLNDICISLDPYGEGTYHKILRANMAQTGAVFIRVSHHCVDETSVPMRNKMPSEVATLRYLKKHTSVPVPDVFAFDPDIDGQVGGAWMIMEIVDGLNASLIWETLTSEQKHKLCLAIGDLYSSLLSLRFDSIGSMHESEGRLFIGPLVTTETGIDIDAAPDPDKCGPFLDAAHWLVATAKGDTRFALPPSSQFHNTAHQSYVCSIIDDINCSTDLAADKTPIVLDHRDFSMQNIIVRSDDPTVIAGIIDWEGARTVPIWATNPRFIWPIFAPTEEKDHFHLILRDHIMETTPEWGHALGEETLPMRLLERRARLSMAKETDFDWSVPPLHFLSATTAPRTSVTYV